MSQLACGNLPTHAEALDSHVTHDSDSCHLESMPEILADIEAIVPPLWPLKDYVAVNPFLGLSHQKFLEARQALCQVRDCELLPGHAYFRTLLEQGDITRADVETAYHQCVQEYPDLYTDLHPDTIMDGLDAPAASCSAGERQFHTVAEVVDRDQGSTWTSHILNDISRHCSAHYDEGQASWSSPWKQLPLYEAWRAAAQLSWRMDKLGITGYQRLVAQLPETATDAIFQLLGKLGIPPDAWRSFLMCEMFSIAGWASFVKYRVREAELAGRRDDDLVGLLAIRLAYDVALAQIQNSATPLNLCPNDGISSGAAQVEAFAPPPDVLARYTLQVAAEAAYRRKLCEGLVGNTNAHGAAGRKTVQMIFCIDVRSEVLRRHLESASDAIETFGFAGFFGMALEYVPLGGSTGPAQCPVLLSPAFRVQENILGADEATQAEAISHRQLRRTARKLWKSFQTSAASCFSFVESLGLTYFSKLLTDSLRLTRPVPAAERDGVPSGARLGPDLHSHGSHTLSNEKKIDLAEGMLRNLGLTEGFARIVAICGHAADVVNNPYKSGLDCGACGGHSGEPNARVAAALLNDRQVREGLEHRGIHIPDDTWFVPGVHNTTTDEIRFLDTEEMPGTHSTEFDQVQAWVQEAGGQSRIERSFRLGKLPAEDIFRRSRDWSEVRPEWGLAGNAAFVVAPRWRTAGLDLGGRTFMHSYDHRKDPESKVLELIMTAPMIVTNWINLQYYASAVDNRAFGSGNKAIHNVVGQLGVLLGNGGDLMTGLPWQSVHDGERFQHDPLRLLVVIEASRDAVQGIIQKHSLVQDLVSNGWLSLVVLDQEQFHRWTSDGTWVAESFDGQRNNSFRDFPHGVGKRVVEQHGERASLALC